MKESKASLSPLSSTASRWFWRFPLGWCSSSSSCCLSNRKWFLLFQQRFLGRNVPVVHHLESKNDVEGETSNESVEDEFIIHLLDCGVDSGEGANEVTKDLFLNVLDVFWEDGWGH